ncbi:unnamed protein product [Ostreobium quekettii]|uniref:Uncharacterized protein n=1 Tax=Ostreobium quekettii TaxID=121088 RepID=A0A8S1IUH9_9CHLO|nr:unnamed protein product [Ostreobium quekettii]
MQIFRNWLRMLAGGEPGWASSGTEEDFKADNEAEVYSKWNRHCRQCPQGQKALKFWGGMDSVLGKAAVGLLGVAVALGVFRTANPHVAVVASVAAGVVVLVHLVMQRLCNKHITDLQYTGMPEVISGCLETLSLEWWVCSLAAGEYD